MDVETLLGQLGDPRPRERVQAIRALTEEGRQLPLGERKRLVEGLARLAEDPEPFVRWRLAASLGELGHPAGIEALRKLAGDAHANTRLRVAQSVAMLETEDGVPLLEQLANDPYKIGEHSVVRAFAALALGRLGSPKAIDALSRLAEDEDGVVRWHAVVALGDVGDPRAAPVLLKRLADPIPFVRGHAAIALAEIGATEHLAEVERAAAKEEHEKMKGVMASALKLLKEASRRGR